MTTADLICDYYGITHPTLRAWARAIARACGIRHAVLTCKGWSGR